MLNLLITLLIGSGLGAALGYYGQCSSGTCPLTANWKRGAVYGAVLGLVFHVASGGVAGSYHKPKNLAAVNETNFDAEVLQASRPVLVDFYATWCGPCKRLAPTLDRVAGELSDQIKFVQVDVDQAPALAQRFEVRGVPTLLLFRDGKATDRMVGAVSEAELKSRLLARSARLPVSDAASTNRGAEAR